MKLAQDVDSGRDNLNSYTEFFSRLDFFNSPQWIVFPAIGSRSSPARRARGAGRVIILVLDGAGWHTAPLAVPEGIRLIYRSRGKPSTVRFSCPSNRYTPELQPAETLWVHLDEPIVNKHFATLAALDAVLAKRCVALAADRDLIRGQAGFHWRPNRVGSK